MRNKCEYICEYYNVPADIGRRIDYNGRGGIIAKDGGNYLGVNFDDNKPSDVYNLHPTEEGLTYLEMGKIRKPTRGQLKYQNFLEADWFDGSFADWINVKNK